MAGRLSQGSCPLKPCVVHLSADYPDRCDSGKTRAIQALVSGTAGHFRHEVYSLNRRSGLQAFFRPGRLTIAGRDDGVNSCEYLAPPKGLLLKSAMMRLADRIAEDLQERELVPDLVQAHKLGIEGISGFYLARRLGRPFALTLQGNTDLKVLRARPDLRKLYRTILCAASGRMAFAPWTAEAVSRLLGAEPDFEIVPCILNGDEVIAPVETPPIVRTAFRLDDWRNKNVGGLLTACSIVLPAFPDLVIEIAGAGSKQAEAAIDGLIAGTGLARRATRVGAISPAEIQIWMNRAAVFVLPSRRESFGMVLLESLLAGVPVVYSSGTAIDGHFPGQPFAVAVDGRDPEAIAQAISAVLSQQKAVKTALQAWQSTAAPMRYQSSGILEQYAAFIDSCLRRGSADQVA